MIKRIMVLSMILALLFINGGSGIRNKTPLVVSRSALESAIIDSKVNELSHNEWVLLYIQNRCMIERLSVKIVHSIIYHESRWNLAKRGELIGDAFVESHMDAYGLMQLLVPTAQFAMKDSTITKEQLMNDNILNVEAGIRYLIYLRRMYRGNMWYSVTAYNRGPGVVYYLLASNTEPSNQYTIDVFRKMTKIALDF